ncbi:uridine kinase [Actinomadura violacea]|uniref:Uridine kinase n=1 Tax=Actinomadura violacea TaxID=2819934 RepID=A0ABS3SB86_9ACTN|nr:uridine kinase [Actinomadura violacea]MBO2465833.1 uridine kinase [Actinomadura violacea]
MRARPITPERAVEEVCGLIADAPRDVWRRVAVDGAPAAEPWVLADALAGPLRAAGRDVVRASARDFLRPASLRYEFGREDPDVFYNEWLDVGGLMREVLGPLEPGGSGKVLPSLWDSARDRATRARYTAVQPGGVLLLDGALLLGRSLPFDVVVHLTMSPGALARRTPEEDSWTLLAFERYEREAAPLRTADVVLKTDDPRHPALVESV